MKSLTPVYLAVFGALFSQHALAATVKGRILDTSHTPVANASIHFHGKKQAVLSDENGYFTLDIDAAGALHISKKNFIDKRTDISPDTQSIEIILTPAAIESVVVYASGLHKNSLEMTSPVSVLSGDELKTRAKPTLGETLKSLPGVNASYFGPVSSSPVIRGLDGPRVKITQNGLDASDASRAGPDHATSSESLSAEQIEVLRGPATLLYGSGAIGGVVNIVDNRIPTDVIEAFTGAAEISHDSVSNSNTLAAKLETSASGINFHFDGVKRNGDDYQTPRFTVTPDHPDEEAETFDSVENTFIESDTYNFGASVVEDHLTLGVAFGRIETDYGVPGHAHHDEHGDEDAAAVDEELAHEEGPGTFARLKQDRWQALASYSLHDSWLETLSVRAGYTDYQHSEIEDGATGTVFSNETLEARFNAEHHIADWHGTLGYHFSDSDYRADGEEAFTPATSTKSHALYVLEEKSLGELTFEIGARIESYDLDSHIETAIHLHEDEATDILEENQQEGAQLYNYSDTNMSGSLGLVWAFTPGYNTAFSLSHSERSPLTAELLSNGLHIATATYELGLGYEIEGTDVHFHGDDIKQETANNVDLSFRKFSGNFGYTVNLFYNDIDNFYYQQNTGLFFDDHEGFITEADEEAMPVYKYESGDARLYGLEFDAHVELSDTLTLSVFGDHINAKLKDAGYLPRIPANKLGSTLEYNQGPWHASMTATRYMKQDKVAEFETETAAYTMLDASISYDFGLSSTDGVLYLNVENITDRLGYVHSSFIKDNAPLPGRNIRMGARFYF